MLSEKKKVLLVDDNEQDAFIICANLRLCGVEPKVVGTLKGAFEEISLYPFPIVLLDLSLPDSDFPATMERVPQMIAAGVQRVIIITGRIVGDTLRQWAHQYGATDIIGKDDRQLQARLLAMVGASHEHD